MGNHCTDLGNESRFKPLYFRVVRISDGVEYSTIEYRYEYEYRKKFEYESEYEYCFYKMYSSTSIVKNSEYRVRVLSKIKFL